MPETQDAGRLPGVLADIVATKWEEIEALRPLRLDLEAALPEAPPVRDFAGALMARDRVSLIAECKRRSPGAGPIRPDLDPVELTRGYESAGASALSVLTDSKYFGGSLDDLRRIRAEVGLPVLRKDFTLDPIQLIEARSAGADAILLIVRILSDDRITELLSFSRELGMTALVETHDQAELERAIAAGARLVGINNRDLSNFTTDIATTERLLGGVPDDVCVVSESGIRSLGDVERLGAVGVDAILVGETLLKSADPGATARLLSSAPRRNRVAGT